MKLLVGNIQRFCLNDGPGIRTTVFTMGCMYRCPWCCNPENLTKLIKIGIITNNTYGKLIDSDDLIKTICKDVYFYSNGGGVTFSGGEFLLNVDDYETILKKLYELKIDICIETSLNAPLEGLQIASKFVSLLIIDFKIINSDLSKKILKSSSKKFLDNFHFIKKEHINYIARIPLDADIISNENLAQIRQLFEEYKPIKIEIFKLHNLAKNKYMDLGLSFSQNYIASEKEVQIIIDYFKNLNVDVEEIKI